MRSVRYLVYALTIALIGLLGFTSDWLFPPEQNRHIALALLRAESTSRLDALLDEIGAIEGVKSIVNELQIGPVTGFGLVQDGGQVAGNARLLARDPLWREYLTRIEATGNRSTSAGSRISAFSAPSAVSK